MTKKLCSQVQYVWRKQRGYYEGQASGAAINPRRNKRSSCKRLTSVAKNADNLATQISLRGISEDIFGGSRARLIEHMNVLGGLWLNIRPREYR
ncbi:hypothetical protein ANTPLA_LOCUS349 [Anthophora plagiata]